VSPTAYGGALNSLSENEICEGEEQNPHSPHLQTALANWKSDRVPCMQSVQERRPLRQGRSPATLLPARGQDSQTLPRMTTYWPPEEAPEVDLRVRHLGPLSVDATRDVITGPFAPRLVGTPLKQNCSHTHVQPQPAARTPTLFRSDSLADGPTYAQTRACTIEGALRPQTHAHFAGKVAGAS